MDYSVRDSSIVQDPHAFAVFDDKDTSLRVGIVREERTIKDGSTRYIVEVTSGGRQIPVSCTILTRFGGAHNFEEYRVRSWVKNFSTGVLPASSASQYSLRSGDVVLVAYLEGQSREGVILGGLKHPARPEVTKKGNIEYISVFNGLETQIRNDGSYKITFKGTPVNDALLGLPPAGQEVPGAAYDPISSGSYFGFDSSGSYVVSTSSSQFLKIKKDLLHDCMVIVSGNNRIDLGGNVAQGKMGLKTDKLIVANNQFSVRTLADIKTESLQLSMKATQMAIGSDQFELFDGLIKLIDALGTLVVTSPFGTCTPLMAAPTWAAQVVPLKVLIQTMKMSLKAADSFEASDEGDITLGGNVGA